MENLAALANACRSPAVARARLFSWLVFNVLVGKTADNLVFLRNSAVDDKRHSFSKVSMSRGLKITRSGNVCLLGLLFHEKFPNGKYGLPLSLNWPIISRTGNKTSNELHTDYRTTR